MSQRVTHGTHMMQTCPHHVELVHKLFVQGTHLWVHQLLVNSQPHSKNVHLSQEARGRPAIVTWVCLRCRIR